MAEISEKVAVGVAHLLGECGLAGEIRTEYDQENNEAPYPQTVVEVDASRWGDAVGSEHQYEAEVMVKYAADGKRRAKADIDADLEIIAETLIDEAGLIATFNYASPYVPSEDLRPVKGVHYHTTIGTSSMKDNEGTLKTVEFTATFAVERVIDSPE